MAFLGRESLTEKRNCKLTHVVNARHTEDKHVFPKGLLDFRDQQAATQSVVNVLSLPR